MKAYTKRRATVAQRRMIENEVIKQYNRIKKTHEQKIADRMTFVFSLALASVADETLGFGDLRRDRLVVAVIDATNELAEQLTNNKVTDKSGKESFDSDYNRDWLARLTKQYHIKFDESIFDDDFEEVQSNRQE